MEYGAETEITSRLLGNELQSYEGLLSDLLHHFHTRNVDYSFNPLTHAVVKTSLYITVVYDHLDCFTALLAAGAQPDLRLLQLPENIIRELSLIHVVISHNANERYVHLFALFGGYLWQRDTLGRLAIDLPVPAASKAALLCYMGKE